MTAFKIICAGCAGALVVAAIALAWLYLTHCSGGHHGIC